jgi:DNA polymerase-4
MILHLDMDAFYASVEEREQPALRGRPVIVGGTPQGRGVVAAANYVARQYGVHSAMPAVQAQRLCPHAVVLPSRMPLYVQESKRIRDIMARYTPLIEPLSLDEAFLDVGGSERLFGSARSIAVALKREILDEIGLVASVGVAPTKFVAKIASDFDKPDGLVCVEPHDVQEFLDDLPIGTLWGVGRATGARFAQLGVRTIGDLRQQSQNVIDALFGRQGTHLWQLAHGIDERAVIPEREAKSISHETTFNRDLAGYRELSTHLHALVEQVAARLRRAQRRAARVQIKVRFDDFRTFSRASTFDTPTDSTRLIRIRATELLAQNVPRSRSQTEQLTTPVRLIGVGVSGFSDIAVEAAQGDLFTSAKAEPDTVVDRVVDNIRGRYGAQALRRGRRPTRRE